VSEFLDAPFGSADYRHTCGVKRYLNTSQVAELAELLEEAPVRTGVVDQVLQAAEERRGMTLTLVEGERGKRAAATDRLTER
jgi:hypothetical protein